MMLSRGERGSLRLQSLDLQIFLDDLFSECKNEEEVYWIESQLQEYVECAAEERMEGMEGGGE